MLSQVIEQIQYENYAQFLQIMSDQNMVFGVFDSYGRCLWSSESQDREENESIQIYMREHLIKRDPSNQDLTREVFEKGASLYVLDLQSTFDENQLSLVVLIHSSESPQETDNARLKDAMRAVGSCINNEIKLTAELESMADELAERYEELNLVYETANHDQKSYYGQESLRRLVGNCTEFLDVGMTALLLPGKRITIYDFNQSAPILNPNKLLGSLQQDLYAWLKSYQEAVVINSLQCAQSYNVDFDIPYKLLVSPVDSGEGKVIGMLVIVNHSWKKDFTNSDRSILDVMAKKVTKVVQANFDGLTGLENRNSFDWSLKEALAQAQSKALNHTLLNIDLDGTSVINDISGRDAGDALIRVVGYTISQLVRSRDVVARVGGDEFGVLLDRCPLHTATDLAQNISKKISEIEFEWDGQQHDVSACIGVAPVTAETESITGLMSSVEVARNAAKEKGRNRLQIYEQNDTDLQRRREEIKWVGRVQAALRENRFQLFAQLIQSLSGKADESHFEILLRMFDENGELVAPGYFMPAAEHYQLMPGIDRWVIRRAVDELLSVYKDLQGLPVAINLSGQSLTDDGFLEFVRDELERLGENKKHICFEITESAAIANLAEATQFIAQIKSMGCRFSLDDFGTGLSSFAYLQNMDVDFLKIDGSFVSKIETDPISETMVSAINQVGHAMGLKTIAEYVENEAILQRLKTMGVDFAQGYALGKPKPFQHCLGELIRSLKTSAS